MTRIEKETRFIETFRQSDLTMYRLLSTKDIGNTISVMEEVLVERGLTVNRLDSIESVPKSSVATGLVNSTVDNKPKDINLTCSNLDGLVKILEDNQKKYREQQKFEMKKKVADCVIDLVYSKGIYNIVKVLKEIMGEEFKTKYKIKAIVNGNITNMILEEQGYDSLVETITNAIEGCFDAFEIGDDISLSFSGVSCEFSCYYLNSDESHLFGIEMTRDDSGDSLTVSFFIEDSKK